jgi:hypothetical protein
MKSEGQKLKGRTGLPAPMMRDACRVEPHLLHLRDRRAVIIGVDGVRKQELRLAPGGVVAQEAPFHGPSLFARPHPAATGGGVFQEQRLKRCRVTHQTGLTKRFGDRIKTL